MSKWPRGMCACCPVRTPFFWERSGLRCSSTVVWEGIEWLPACHKPLFPTFPPAHLLKTCPGKESYLVFMSLSYHLFFRTEEMGQKTKSLCPYAPTLRKDENTVQIPQCRNLLPCLQRISKYMLKPPTRNLSS